MRVLFVTHNIPRFAGDAAGSFVLRLAVALQACGIHVDVIAPGTNDQVGDDIIEGIAIRRIRYARNMTIAYGGTMAEAVRASHASRLAFLGLFRAMRAETRRFVREAQRTGTPVDVIHAHWWIPAGIAAWLARFGSASMPPYMVTMHGSDVRLARTIRLVHPLMRRVLQRARAVTAVSGWLARTANALTRVHVDVGPMPVDESTFAPNAARPRTRSVLFVGRLNAQKGVADLLDAMADEQLRTAQLDIVGDGPDETALRARAISLGIADRVRWHGRLPSAALLPLYQSACVVAMPSREEGLGLVAVEAQLCETPVVAYDSGGLPDVVLPAAGGTLVAVGDRDALTQALSLYIDQPDVRERNGVTARAAMLERFSSNAVARRYADWYTQVVERAR